MSVWSWPPVVIPEPAPVVPASGGTDLFPAGTPPNPNNEEFDGTADAMPAGWAFYSDSAGGASVRGAASCIVSPGSPIVGVDPYVNLAAAANNCSSIRFNVNSRRKSWLLVQLPAESGAIKDRWMLAKRHATVLPDDFVVIIRLMTIAKTTINSSELNGQMEVGVYGESAGVLRPGNVIGGAGAFMILRPGAGGFEATFLCSDGTQQLVNTKTFGSNSSALGLPEYVKIVRRLGAITAMIGWSGGSWTPIATGQAGAAAHGIYRWWGIAGISHPPSAGVDSLPYPYGGVDYMRRYDTNDLLLEPL